LTFLAEDGFESYFGRYGYEEKSAHEWRQRHLLRALRERPRLF